MGHRATMPTVVRRRVAAAFAAFTLIGATDGATGVVLPSLQAQYGIGKGVVSLIFLALTTGYIAAAFGSGLLVALLGQRRFLALGAATFAVGAGVVSLRPPFALLLATMLGLGFGFAVIDAGLNTYITGLPENTTLLNYSGPQNLDSPDASHFAMDRRHEKAIFGHLQGTGRPRTPQGGEAHGATGR